MSEKSSELEQRMAVVETKVVDLKESISEIKEITYSVKEHLSRQNGILPRLEKSFANISDQISTFDKKLDTTAEKVVAISLKMKIVWGIFATVGGTILVAAVSYLISKI